MNPDPTPKRLLEGGGEGSDDAAVRQLLGRMAAPPIDEIARERVWRRMTASTPVRRIPQWAFAAAMAMVILTLVVSVRDRARVLGSTVQTTAGEVAIARRGEAWSPSTAGTELGEDTRLRTGTTGHVSLRMGPQVALEVGNSSDLAIEEWGKQRFLRWSGSGLGVSVEGADPALVLQATRYGVRATRAAFEVLEQAAGEVVVRVDRGEVEIFEGERRWRVTAGERWSSLAQAGAPSAAAADVKGPPLHRTQSDEALPGPAVARGQPTPSRAADHATTAHSVLVEPAPPAEPAPSIGTSSVIALRSVDAPAPTPSPVAVSPALPMPVSATPLTPAPMVAPAPTPTPIAPPIPLVETPAPHLYEDALDLEHRGRYSDAAQRLKAAASIRSGHADLALYELGRVRQRQLGDLAGAREAFTQYRHDYPAGSLQQEVRLSLIEIDVALPQADAAQSEASDFLAAYPSSERAPDIRLLRANLRRTHGDCDGAIADYRELAASPKLGEDALFFSAWCQRQQNELDDAEASLRAMLQRFPHGQHAAEAQAALAGSK